MAFTALLRRNNEASDILMGLFQNIAKKAAISASRSELKNLKSKLSAQTNESAVALLGRIADSREGIEEMCNVFVENAFAAVLSAKCSALRTDESIRQNAALLLNPLTEMQQSAETAVMKASILFWRITIMSTLHDELWEEGHQFWEMIEDIEEEGGASQISSMRPKCFTFAGTL